MSDYEVLILFNGYSFPTKDGLKANCTCTLLKSKQNNIIIDTRTPWDGDQLQQALQQHNLAPEDINFCICTHGHSDHVGCNYLFKEAVHIVGKNSISKHDLYQEHDFQDPFVIDDYIKIIASPGHTEECVSVLAKSTIGLVAIVGDLFEKKEDLENDYLWKCCSWIPEVQEKSRKEILKISDYIVPGHGEMFKNILKCKIDE